MRSVIFVTFLSHTQIMQCAALCAQRGAGRCPVTICREARPRACASRTVHGTPPTSRVCAGAGCAVCNRNPAYFAVRIYSLSLRYCTQLRTATRRFLRRSCLAAPARLPTSVFGRPSSLRTWRLASPPGYLGVGVGVGEYGLGWVYPGPTT